MPPVVPVSVMYTAQPLHCREVLDVHGTCSFVSRLPVVRVSLAKTLLEPLCNVYEPPAVAVPNAEPVVPPPRPTIAESAAGENPVVAAHWWLVVDEPSSNVLEAPNASVPDVGMISMTCHENVVVPPLTVTVIVALPPVVQIVVCADDRIADVVAVSTKFA